MTFSERAAALRPSPSRALAGGLGPLVAGVVIGVSEAVTMAVTSPSWAPLVSFTLLIVILLVRPAGIFGKAVAEKV